MEIGLAIAPPRLTPPHALVVAVEATLGEGVRLRPIRLRRDAHRPVMQVDRGGTRTPAPTLGAELRELARKHLGDDVGVRVTYRYEVLVR